MGVTEWIPEFWRHKAIDAGLTRAADAADTAGMPHQVADTLRSLRTDPPFIEAMEQGLVRATELLSREPTVATEVVDFLARKVETNPTDVLKHLEALLFTVAETYQAAIQDFVADLESSRPEHIDSAQLALAVSIWAQLLRQQLWAHPKLVSINQLFLQYTQTLATQRLTSEIIALGQTMREGIGAGLPALASARQLGASTPPAARAGTQPRTSEGHLPDILTPDTGTADVLSSYAPIVGPEAASWLAQVQQRVVRSIEKGEFDEQDRIAEEIASTDVGLPDLTVTGHYLQGEARRLMSDMAQDPATKARLLTEAISSYETALDLNPGETRATRGLARSLEVQGDIGRALSLFEDARIRALTALRAGGEQSQNGILHEALRSTRHYAACIVDAIDQNPRSVWSGDLGLLQLHGLSAESEQLHKATMGKFKGSSDWIDIEWFMGLVLLAKGYARAGDTSRAWRTLLFSLFARVKMFDTLANSRTAVELANLRWWCTTALRLDGLSSESTQLVHTLQHAAHTQDVLKIELTTQDLLKPISPPWGAATRD